MDKNNDEIDELFHKLHVYKRKQVIHSLLAGNDTQCFSTEQYMRKMFVETMKIAKEHDAQFFNNEYWHDRAREQLQAERMVEVKPDVWRMP